MKKLPLLFAIVFCLSHPLLHAGSPGKAAANFLKMGIGARGSAMGEAQTALVEDVTSLYWNPAGLSGLRFKEVSLMHYSLVENVRYQQAGLGLPLDKWGAVAFGLNLLDYGDIKSFDNNAIPTGSVDASNLLLSAGWGKQIFGKSNLRAGGTVKYLQSELAGFKASAPMLDLGLKFPYRSDKLRGLSFGAALRNIGPDIKYDTESSPLPQHLVFGAGLSALGGNLNMALDFIHPNDGDAHIAAGVEYKLLKMIQLRAGYNGNSDFVGNGITYGMGLQFTQWNLDYAFVPFGDLGDTNRVSVGIRFGRAAELHSAEAQVDEAYDRARSLLAHGHGVQAYSNVIDLLLIAPWHKPSVELKTKIEKRFTEMEKSRNKTEMETEIATHFTQAKASFDRDELIEAKKGFTTIMALQPDHVSAKVYLDRIKNRYESLANDSFQQGMDYFAKGEYGQAKIMFEKTLTIDESHDDARVQLAKTEQLIEDRSKRIEEIQRLAGAADSYRQGLKLFNDKDWEKALERFKEVQSMVPDYQEVTRYYNLTVKTYSKELFENSKGHIERGELNEAKEKLSKAKELSPDNEQIWSALKVVERDLSINNARESKRLYRDGLEAYLAGKTDKAEKLWKEALELDNSNEDALKALSKLEEQKAFKEKKDEE